MRRDYMSTAHINQILSIQRQSNIISTSSTFKSSLCDSRIGLMQSSKKVVIAQGNDQYIARVKKL